MKSANRDCRTYLGKDSLGTNVKQVVLHIFMIVQFQQKYVFFSYYFHILPSFLCISKHSHLFLFLSFILFYLCIFTLTHQCISLFFFFFKRRFIHLHSLFYYFFYDLLFILFFTLITLAFCVYYCNVMASKFVSPTSSLVM